MIYIKFILFFISVLVGLFKFLFLIKSNLLYIIPFTGCCIGLLWLLKLIIILVKNLPIVQDVSNMLMNLAYLMTNKINPDDPRVVEFFTQLTLPPKDFKKKYRYK